MLGALASVPATTASALAMAGAKHTVMSATTDTAPAAMDTASEAMPCHKQAAKSPCPHCPDKSCPEMGTCLVKCFQQLVPPLAADTSVELRPASMLAPTQTHVAAGSLVSPLLRPPSA